MPKQFTKTTENFVCGNCKTKVKGNGYTNHCPNCFFSKHVDIFPGDRLETCGGLMEPVAIEAEKDHYVLTHKCLTCGEKRRCRTSERDNIENLAKLAESLAKKALS